jgi:integrase
MSAVDTQSIQLLINRCDLGSASKQDLRNTLSAVFAYAKIIQLWEKVNPCEGVKVGRKTRVREKLILTPDQLAAFLAAITDTRICSAADARLLILTAIVTAFRASELFGLQVGDLNLEGQTLTVRRRWHRGDIDVPKTEASKRTRPVGALATELAAALAIGKPADGFLWERDRLPLDDRDVQQHILKPAARRAGCDFAGFGLHTFRRMHITWKQEVGATPIEAMKSAGHTNVNMTYLYSIVDASREKEQVQRLLDRVRGKEGK